MGTNTKVGSYTGTGAAVNVELGFTPAYVKIWNATDGDEIYEWFSGMTAGHALKSANHASAQFSRITANGVTAYAGTDTTGSEAAEGFTAGTAISESAKTFRWIAHD